MRFYTKQHKFYCGIDLHARKMYVCIINNAGEILLHRHEVKRSANIKTDRHVFLKVIFTWYWIADLCAQKGITFAFALGHALYMKAIHGGKAKNGKIDSQKIVVLLKGGMIPQKINFTLSAN